MADALPSEDPLELVRDLALGGSLVEARSLLQDVLHEAVVDERIDDVKDVETLALDLASSGSPEARVLFHALALTAAFLGGLAPTPSLPAEAFLYATRARHLDRAVELLDVALLEGQEEAREEARWVSDVLARMWPDEYRALCSRPRVPLLSRIDLDVELRLEVRDFSRALAESCVKARLMRDGLEGSAGALEAGLARAAERVAVDEVLVEAVEAIVRDPDADEETLRALYEMLDGAS